jgi:hypothetical protein
MKIKIILKNIENNKSINPIDSFNSISNSIITLNGNTNLTKDLFFIIEKKNLKIEVLEIKKFISSKIFETKELISLFKKKEKQENNDLNDLKDLKELADQINILEEINIFSKFEN